jgi:hypothetical protein
MIPEPFQPLYSCPGVHIDLPCPKMVQYHKTHTASFCYELEYFDLLYRCGVCTVAHQRERGRGEAARVPYLVRHTAEEGGRRRLSMAFHVGLRLAVLSIRQSHRFWFVVGKR